MRVIVLPSVEMTAYSKASQGRSGGSGPRTMATKPELSASQGLAGWPSA
ncbi:MAG: hypothetical protein M5U18_07435 [Dehalococcoidia bacterium]|nr:hypothetical protein [Dehalococcoidia bacterium]